jgi:CheY-like chemotaxis protein
MSVINVLVAEDDKLNRLMLCRLLAKLGTETTDASNGQEAVEKELEGSFDIVLLDYNMPVYSGAESARLIRENCERDGRRTPLLVCVSADEDLRDSGVFDCFLPKPFKIEDIQGILDKIAQGE